MNRNQRRNTSRQGGYPSWLAIVAAFSVAFGGFNPQKAGLLRSVAAVLGRASDKDWDVDREIIGWGLGGKSCLCDAKVSAFYIVCFFLHFSPPRREPVSKV